MDGDVKNYEQGSYWLSVTLQRIQVNTRMIQKDKDKQYKTYQCSHFDNFGQSSVKAFFTKQMLNPSK